MSPSATPATQSRRHCHEVPHLPPKVSVHATKCNACHAKGRVAATKRSTKASPASPCATPATQSGRQYLPHTTDAASQRPSAPPEPTQCHQVQRLPHKVSVDVAKYENCHAKCASMPPSTMPAPRKDRSVIRVSLRCSFCGL